jgi:chemotaxis response regulator CheB
MPGEAVAVGAAQSVLPLPEIAAAVCELAESMDLTKSRTS